MDRLARFAAHGTLALLLGSTASSLGCRSMKSEIPPGKAYSTTGSPAPGTSTPSVGFSSDARQDTGSAAGLYPDIQQTSGNPGSPAAQGGVQRATGDAPLPQFGTPVGNNANYAMPATGKYGPPGTSGLPASNPPVAERSQPITPPAESPSPRAGSNNPLQGALGVDLPN